jgi:hypothetical protein
MTQRSMHTTFMTTTSHVAIRCGSTVDVKEVLPQA